MLECSMVGPSAAGAGRLASRLFLRIELTEVKERAPISSAGGLQPIRAIALGQAEDADGGAKALLGVRALAHDDLDQRSGVASDLAGLAGDPLRCPIGVAAMARRHVVANRGMPPVR